MVASGKLFALLAPLFATGASAMFSASKEDFLKVYKENNIRIPEGAPTHRRSVEVHSKRQVGQAAPHWTVYQDKWANSPPDVADIAGFNGYYLAFLLSSGVADMAQSWTEMTEDARNTVLAFYKENGIKLMVSAFGSTDHPTTAKADPVATANSMAQFVKDNHLDGIDVDYEDFDAFAAGTAEAWLIAFTTQLRSQLPSPDYIITHAPVAPWFTPTLYPGGGYLKINSEVGDLIDFYNVQFYNQGTTEYTTCEGLLDASSSQWPKTAVFEIGASGVPLDKIVIGKPGTAGDATNGQMEASLLAQCLQTAKGKGWSGGAMVWQYPNAGKDWIKTVRSLSWPTA